MPRIEEQFADRFKNWGIRLPDEAAEARTRGKISNAGRSIWCLFGSDEQGKCLDYYAVHRLTNDRSIHTREDDSVEFLPSPADPEKDAKLRAASFEKNRRIVELLEAKGFDLSGDEPRAIESSGCRPLTVGAGGNR